MAEIAETQGATTATQQPLVMQIVVRRDLLDAEGWGVGPLMAQVAHATSAVLHETRERPETQAYMDDLKNMRKVVMQTTDQASIEKLAKLLDGCDPPVPYHLWVEQPENVPTCLALSPNRREPKVKKALDKSGCRLWKG
ncbi:peptidyl-tRNA hydrolase II [Lentinus tigrinus ALCF2SS1-7]|uniref:peptidyl-tRNA hydrolase n=1 Tax=Lentinus tigrinus ALCF2SS1-6 TaxID=1328759 RepID=A0A5C2S2M5_9APHY|nr:peptidyl-tRNA hydrolase II [Lentinus tigrinus ALCF2SS1-6]RPD71884.1 peptidyl-tRNA hydrolase II [Lentinus tigrinus ALCF2SS1-7]